MFFNSWRRTGRLGAIGKHNYVGSVAGEPHWYLQAAYIVLAAHCMSPACIDCAGVTAQHTRLPQIKAKRHIFDPHMTHVLLKKTVTVENAACIV